MKKNIAKAVVTSSLVALVGVGGTFAYLTANSGQVVNTFKGAEALDVTIKESAEDGDTYDIAEKGSTDLKDHVDVPEQAAGSESGIDYLNVVPGASLDKEVTAVVKKNVTDSYLAVKIDGAAAPASIPSYLTNEIGGETLTWTPAGDYLVLTKEDGTPYRVNSQAGDVAFDIFDTVEIAADAEIGETGNLENISF